IWEQLNLFRVRGLYTYSKENAFYACKLSTVPPDVIFFTPLRHLERQPNRHRKGKMARILQHWHFICVSLANKRWQIDFNILLAEDRLQN
ncbi:13520_t:CDS:1, partial [Dentiscutata heterogama]